MRGSYVIEREGEKRVFCPYYDESLIATLEGGLQAQHPQTSTDLSRVLAVSKPTVSHHIRLMRDAGLVVAKRRKAFATSRYNRAALRLDRGVAGSIQRYGPHRATDAQTGMKMLRVAVSALEDQLSLHVHLASIRGEPFGGGLGRDRERLLHAAFGRRIPRGIPPRPLSASYRTGRRQLAAIAISGFSGHFAMWLLFVGAGVYGFLRMISLAGVPTLILGLVPEEDLGTANALEAVSFSFANVAGPIAAGLLLSRFGGFVAIGADAVRYLVFVAFLACVPVRGEFNRANGLRSVGLGEAVSFIVGARAILATTMMFIYYSPAYNA